MGLLGNIVWFVFGGCVAAFAWAFVGALWCITVIGIPVGLQCFKMAELSLWPFGKNVVYGGNTFSFIVNLLWILLSGIELAAGFAFIGILFCCTVVGIPFGLQFFKFAKLALMPFGAEVV